MDTEDKRRLFVIGSVMIEIVVPLLRKRLENFYKKLGFCDVHTFLISMPVQHMILNSRQPFHHKVFKTLYGNISHFPAVQSFRRDKRQTKCVKLHDLDAEILIIILMNCCQLDPSDQKAILQLQQYKNDFARNITGCGGISQTEYNAIWPDIRKTILQLDPSFLDNLMRLQSKPLDDSTELFDIHTKLEEIGSNFSMIKESVQHSKIESHIMLAKIEESKNETSKLMMMASMENHELLKGSYDQIQNMVSDIKEVIRSQQTEPDKSNEETNKIIMAKLEEMKDSYHQLHSMITEMKSTSQHQERHTGEAQDSENMTQCGFSSDVDVPNLTNVRKINKLCMVVDQKQNAPFTLFSEGSHVQVGTIVVGDQNITMTSVDGMSQTTTNTQSIDSSPTQNNALSLNTNSLFLLMLLLPCVIVIFVQNFLT